MVEIPHQVLHIYLSVILVIIQARTAQVHGRATPQRIRTVLSERALNGCASYCRCCIKQHVFFLHSLYFTALVHDFWLCSPHRICMRILVYRQQCFTPRKAWSLRPTGRNCSSKSLSARFCTAQQTSKQKDLTIDTFWSSSHGKVCPTCRILVFAGSLVGPT